MSLTAGLLRKDRPIHLLGIGGVRDIFHGVRQGATLSHTHDKFKVVFGVNAWSIAISLLCPDVSCVVVWWAGIDTFDCVHPTRIGRHGCALVLAHYW